MTIKFYMNEIIYSVSFAADNFWKNLNFTDYTKEFVIIPDNIIIDLKNFHNGIEETNFTTKLIQLIMKADIDNFSKLSEVYPNECYVVWCYKNISGFVEKYLKG